jgi:hypothetical protein
MKGHASCSRACASSRATALTASTLYRENIKPGAFEPVHDLLKCLERDALLAILQAKEA